MSVHALSLARRAGVLIALALALLASGPLGCGTPRRLDGERSQGTKVHRSGVLNPDDQEAFHGALLRGAGWDFTACAPCHGEDLRGGASGVSCLSCHKEGVTACATCHSARRMSGAHPAHLLGATQGKPLGCAECHRTPKDYRDPGHLYEEDGAARTRPVEVVFGALAAAVPKGITRTVAPAWQPEARTCAYVYCHGGASLDRDTQATNTRPGWIADPKLAACGTCHGLPPASHERSQTRCYLCHNRTAGADRALLPGGLHVSGVAELGDGSGKCNACHGGPGGAAPPGDLLRGEDPSSIGVGAHQAHMQATHRLRGPLACGDCHQVPEQVDSPGHLDADGVAEVFPSGTAGGLAFRDGARPRWDRAAARCDGDYCHGGGQKLARDMTPGLLRAPVWTKPGQAACGTCHGVPPKDGDHAPGLRLQDCATCHPATMDPSGAILLSGPRGAETSAHMNGVIDAK